MKQTKRAQQLLQQISAARRGLSQARALALTAQDSEVGDIADEACRLRDLETSLLLQSRCEKHLKDLERAWTRYCEDRDGQCESCGVQIDPDRLVAMPGTTLCLECQGLWENGGRAHVTVFERHKPQLEVSPWRTLSS